MISPTAEAEGSPAPYVSERRRILSTRLYPPRARSNQIHRNHLIERIGFEFDQQIVLISAPAGYGKSTLVSQWISRADIPVAWISLDTSDNDPLSFFTLFISALQSIDPTLGISAFAILEEQGLTSELAVTHSLIEDLSTTTRPFALVLDDYHLIESPAVHRSVSLLLKHLPHLMRLFILSRSTPDLPLARHRSRGELIELEHEDLRFSHREAIKMMELVDGVELSIGEIGVLNERAEGWPAGLQLVTHLVRHQSKQRVTKVVEEFSGGLEPIESYLWEEVLNALPESSIDFLVRCSVFSQFCPELCDFALNRTDSDRLIRDLDRAHLFIVPLDDVGEWRRYHHLFRDVLRDRLVATCSESEIKLIHSSAANWLMQRGFIDEAAKHAIAGEDWETARPLLTSIAEDHYRNDNITSLQMRLSNLPPEVFADSPELAFLYSWALVRNGRAQECLSPLRAAEALWAQQNDHRNLGRVEIVLCFSEVIVSNFQLAVQHAQRALELLPLDDHAERAAALVFMAAALLRLGEPLRIETALRQANATQLANNLWLRGSETAVHGQLLVMMGLLREAAVLYRRTIRSESNFNSMQVQQAIALMSIILVEWNEIDEAEQLIRTGLRLAEETGTVFWNGRYHLGLAQVERHRGNGELALDEIELAIGLLEAVGSRHETRVARAMQARLWLDTNQLALARRWADRCDLDPHSEQSYERFPELTTYIRLLLAAEQQIKTAVELLLRLLESAESARRRGDVIEIRVLLSIAYRLGGNMADSLNSLELALALAEPNGYIKVFTNEGRGIAPQLRNLSVRGSRRDYVRRLLLIIDDETTEVAVRQPDLFESLSERELEVLRLVAAGLSNRAIGERLFITETTVKKHIGNVLGKLQTTNRTQAVDQARRMGLLGE